MISAALTSFLTGITEPIEFSFLFVAPGLYFVHACWQGLVSSSPIASISIWGYTFSQGGIDFLLFNVLGKNAHNVWMTLILGPAYAAVYYVVFSGRYRAFQSADLPAAKTTRWFSRTMSGAGE